MVRCNSIGNNNVRLCLVSGEAHISTNNLSCPQNTIQDEIADLLSCDDNNMDHDNNMNDSVTTTQKQVVEQPAKKTEASSSLKTDSGQEEPDSLMLENVQRELAILISKNPAEIQHNIVTTRKSLFGYFKINLSVRKIQREHKL